VNLLFEIEDAEEVSRVEGFLERLVERGLSMDGTCTGEHGVGQAKLKYMALEHDAPALAAMRALKSALDPLGIMNPGKLVG
jgi:D-lactate dehydrogenase (cytochrome)